jgi:hypothetical protein
MKVWIGPYKKDESPRKEEISIHDYDTWNMDHTLALIALPMLKQLKETKHGVPTIDYEDMPEHLQYIRRADDPRAIYDMIDQSQQPEWDDLNEIEFQRQIKCWDWIMNEMIWAMEQVVENNEDQFYDHSEVNDSEQDIVVRARQIKIDLEGLKQYYARVGNGLKLFGKYYRSLWD